mmetsp:Transcript_5550/g.15489  ORF Transcript_5550/g.15489 Transcript_5550/m.15489 type:complete len:250 (-) Transcript_5550:303-1052(-)
MAARDSTSSATPHRGRCGQELRIWGPSASPGPRMWPPIPRTGRRLCLLRRVWTRTPSTKETGNGADTFGTVYIIKTDFKDLSARVTILYDGDADEKRRLRSPDNLDWADDGFIYVQEDEAEETTLTGEPLFGEGAANPNEAGIVRIDPHTKAPALLRVANIDRDVVLDASIANPTDAVDVDAGDAGEWESSGILDVSELFDEKPGTLFLFNVQAHGITDQAQFNEGSAIIDEDLVEGGQMIFLEKAEKA